MHSFELCLYGYRATSDAPKLAGRFDAWRWRGMYRAAAPAARELSETQSQISRGRGGSEQGANEGGCEKCEREGK